MKNLIKTFTILSLIFVLGCSKEETVSTNDLNKFTVVEIDQDQTQSRGLIGANGESAFLFPNLSSCNLSSYAFPNFSNNMTWHNIYDQFVPTLGIGGSGAYGEFPSQLLAKGLTAIYYEENIDFLKVEYPSGSDINPVTGLPYQQIRFNTFFHSYQFLDPGYFDWQGNQQYNYLTGDANDSNVVKELVACKLLEVANDIDSTAFITDIGINVDYSNASIPPNDQQTRAAIVYVKWGYFY